MQNSMDQSLPIRVVRGHKNVDSYSGKIYSYDGIYKVVYIFLWIFFLVFGGYLTKAAWDQKNCQL